MSFRDVFARGATVMMEKAGDVATYEHKEGGPSFEVKVVIRSPEQSDPMAYGGGGKSSVRVEAVIAKLDIGPGRPRKGDLIALGSEKGWRVEAVEQDSTEAFYILGLARQD